MINEDYNDFVSLSTKLVNVDGALARMQAPLLELQVGWGAPSLPLKNMADVRAVGLPQCAHSAAWRVRVQAR